jgi:hypothetical protein
MPDPLIVRVPFRLWKELSQDTKLLTRKWSTSRVIGAVHVHFVQEDGESSPWYLVGTNA